MAKKNKYGLMPIDEVRRLAELEREKQKQRFRELAAASILRNATGEAGRGWIARYALTFADLCSDRREILAIYAVLMKAERWGRELNGNRRKR